MKNFKSTALTFILAAVTVLSATAIFTPADARPSTRSYSCPEVRDLIRTQGAVVMDTKNTSIYRRFVHSLHYCKPPDNSLVKYSVPTKTGTCKLKICDEWRPFN